MNEEPTVATRQWRTMFHVIYRHRDEIWVRIPGWDSNLAVRILASQFTDEMRQCLDNGEVYFYGLCAFGADHHEDLDITINERSTRNSNG